MIIMMQHNEEEEKVAQEARRQELLEKERFFPGEAVEYLLLVRGIKTSVVSLRGRRGRKTIEAEHEGYRNTTYTKAQLDAYKVAPQTKVVPGSEAAQRREEMRRNRGRRKKAPKNH